MVRQLRKSERIAFILLGIIFIIGGIVGGIVLFSSSIKERSSGWGTYCDRVLAARAAIVGCFSFVMFVVFVGVGAVGRIIESKWVAGLTIILIIIIFSLLGIILPEYILYQDQKWCVDYTWAEVEAIKIREIDPPFVTIDVYIISRSSVPKWLWETNRIPEIKILYRLFWAGEFIGDGEFKSDSGSSFTATYTINLLDTAPELFEAIVKQDIAKLISVRITGEAKSQLFFGLVTYEKEFDVPSIPSISFDLG